VTRDVPPPTDPLADRARGLALGLLILGVAALLGCGLLVFGLSIVRPQPAALGISAATEHVLDLPVQPGPALPSPTPNAPVGAPPASPTAPTSRATPTPTGAAAADPPATPTPSQYYITCGDGRTIVGTTTQGACAGQGGVLSVSATPPEAPTPGGAEATVAVLAVQGAAPGGQASVTVQTQPGRSCSIVYTSPAGEVSNAAGLNNQAADRTGRASWRWTIAPATPPGVGKVTVRCGSASATAEIMIG
jgi:hypothetical protein